MVDERDPLPTSPGETGDTPFDPAILRQQTGGNRDLERDVLRLFLGSGRDDTSQLKAAKTAEERRRIAHRLVGAAGAVGALQVARLAASVERRDAQVMAELEAALTKATEEITQYLAE
jgi:HPt (histidine-containing phosphotransfer) domain-containing protein